MDRILSGGHACSCRWRPCRPRRKGSGKPAAGAGSEAVAGGQPPARPGDPYLPKKSPLIRKLELTDAEVNALVAWLGTL
ncbi:MAG: hypothetical protein MK041_02955 [Aquabacterium sp.]|nr:hypothetical protein [Aquabacterium sp.]